MPHHKIYNMSFLSFIVLATFLSLSCSSKDKSSDGLNTNAQQEFLPVEEAFVFAASAENQTLLKAQWKIAEGYHLYKDKFKFSVTPETYQIVEIKYPKADVFSDKNLGELESYKGTIEVSIKITGSLTDKKINLSSTYQGCADVGLCYPPQNKKTEFNLASL